MNDEQDAAPPSHDASAPLTGGPPRPSPAIVSALRGEFRRLIEDGDLDDNLTKIEQLAARSRDLFIALKGAESKLIARAGHPYAMSSGGGNWGTSVAMQPAMPNVEQFGASAIRQVVDNLPEVAATVAERSPTPSRMLRRGRWKPSRRRAATAWTAWPTGWKIGFCLRHRPRTSRGTTSTRRGMAQRCPRLRCP